MEQPFRQVLKLNTLAITSSLRGNIGVYSRQTYRTLSKSASSSRVLNTINSPNLTFLTFYEILKRKNHFNKNAISRIVNRRDFSLVGSHLYSNNNISPNDFSKSSDHLRIQNILLRKNQQRMDRQLFLKEADTFYKKFKLNTKWFLIKENRPFSHDEISAMFSWLIISQLIWIILGTTTFVSIILFFLNTVFAKEFVGKSIGRSLNFFLDGIDVQFGDAMVPEWKNRYIKFNNVRIKSITGSNKIQHNNINDDIEKKNRDERDLINFDLSLHEMLLTISLKSWLMGKGLIENISIFGMTGSISISDPAIISLVHDKTDDKRWSTNYTNEPFIYKWFSNPNYELKNIHIEDSNFELQDNQMNKNYSIAIYNLELPILRLNWVLFDFLNADIADGSINGALFNIHKKQHKLAYIDDMKRDLSDWERITRLRLDSIKIADLGLNESTNFSWINSGSLEIIADIMLPHNYDSITNIFNKSFISDEESDTSNKYIYVDLKFKFKDLKACTSTKNTPVLSTGEPIISPEELKLLVSFINAKHEIFHSITTVDRNSSWNFPNTFIKKNKSFPKITVLSSLSNKEKYLKGKNDEDIENEDELLDHQIIKFHDQLFQDDSNEIILRCRFAKNIKDLRNITLFNEAAIYDTITMELYGDFMKLVEEWEYKKKNDWMKIWGSTLASQLIFFGFGAMV
ncbi:hypothetical protein TBLA_0A02520 [Henningerozyma blattae CBS 6284]|uniref:Mitochondrial distribution and morphology protein 32 n=1 Tax=Henningerozyma blattae (strain ATCC 34711 / CBS 6284 / DSM 70876 / NBRC 10599 / NRRL Y-10934 / UCD 77-7) TaxID=1071380 RepID=I2GV99_HENB6|nr:hypothetical protein TBLA_0A02520 [Tetrapisispora blattae CBS 6284]CCH58051.1 hypothetical protein TBLA_0A02520 [Tetrapisispora blattae CBS 6284]